MGVSANLDIEARLAVPTTQRAKADTVSTIWAMVIASMVLAWVAGKMELYTAGDDVGYYLGLVGGVMMLVLLLYPLAKRIRFLQSIMRLKYWFKYHMLLGIVGPITIFFHSTMQLESTNGAVAFYSMLAVFFSGLVGRYFYTRIHKGLFGREESLEELKTRLGMDTQAAHSLFYFAPNIEKLLTSFEKKNLSRSGGAIGWPIRFLMRPMRYYLTYARAKSALRQALRKQAKKRGWDRAKTSRKISKGKAFIRRYLDNVERVAQFRAYERILSMWHYLHVPLMLLLVVSGVIHVLAVHMY